MTMSSMTPAEKETAYYLANRPNIARLFAEIDDHESEDEMEARIGKTYEVQLEQSEFRREVIEEILKLCDAPGTKRELVAAIRNLVDNSYVEL